MGRAAYAQVDFAGAGSAEGVDAGPAGVAADDRVVDQAVALADDGLGDRLPLAGGQFQP